MSHEYDALIFSYVPYNPDPAQLKKKTDRALELLNEIKSVQLDENKMKPREVKALAQVITNNIGSNRCTACWRHF